MNKTLVAALVAISAAAQAYAMPSHDAAAAPSQGYAIYQRVFLGINTGPAPQAFQVQAATESRVPGSYARYLMYFNGLTEDQAFAVASRSGEPATMIETPAESTVVFNSYERYLRTVLGYSDSDVLARRVTHAH